MFDAVRGETLDRGKCFVKFLSSRKNRFVYSDDNAGGTNNFCIYDLDEQKDVTRLKGHTAGSWAACFYGEPNEATTAHWDETGNF